MTPVEGQVPAGELMGVRVADGAASFRIAAPLIDRPLPGRRGRIVADADGAILHVDAVGTFCVARGRELRFDPEPDVAPATVTTWVHGSVAALLLAQRGCFALHASVVEVDGVGVAVSGPSRSGKSTTGLRLAQRGHTLVTDDVSPVTGARPATVHPFERPLHVYAETAGSLGIDISGAEPVLPTNPKLALPMPPRAPVRLGAIVVLQPREPGAGVDAQRVHGAAAHWQVERNLYRTEILGDLYRTAMFEWASKLAQSVPLHVVNRPSDGWTVDEVADAVEAIASLARVDDGQALEPAQIAADEQRAGQHVTVVPDHGRVGAKSGDRPAVD